MDREYIITDEGWQWRVWEMDDDNAPGDCYMIIENNHFYWGRFIGKWSIKSGMKMK